MGNRKNNGFTLPGEAGYEKLTLELAERWGADVIRDSDGTKLSEDILKAGYGIYSTVCPIRGHNEWIKKNMDKLQGTFLMTPPVVAKDSVLQINLMDSFYSEQFSVMDLPEALEFWQVYDRTTDREVERNKWKYSRKTGCVILEGIQLWHIYTVSFLAYRIWEEISMYNHITNHWNSEHLMPIDPVYPEVQEYLLDWMEKWCKCHPATTVVRFTSMFYNFVWIWGENERNRNLFTDWASYDFTVSLPALIQFEKRYGYRLTAEDFINKGKLHATHAPCDNRKKDWMDFIQDFVAAFGKKMVDIVHSHGKKAYVFYDDSWIGVEPYGEKFKEIGFDGIIKAVFSAFEVRLAGDVCVSVHELRLHPYLFPTGVDGSPSFLEEGRPVQEAERIWKAVRRGILRTPIERIGLGGYLHLVERKPEFIEYMEKLSDEFCILKKLHQDGKPYCLKPKIAVLHFWGKLRSWSLSGHMHETEIHDLIHINEALAGLPFEVAFLDFDDIRRKKHREFDVIINAGKEGDAWSGGKIWEDEQIISELTEWVYEGGVFIGVGEPSAVRGHNTCFRMAHILGVDKDTVEEVCHGKWQFTVEDISEIGPSDSYIYPKVSCHLTDGRARVLKGEGTRPAVTLYKRGKGCGVYLASFRSGTKNNRFLMNLILYAVGEDPHQKYLTDNPETECAYYPGSRRIAVINHADTEQSCRIGTGTGEVACSLAPGGFKLIELSDI